MELCGAMQVQVGVSNFSLFFFGVSAAVFPSVVHVYKRVFVSMSVYLAEVI